MANVSIKRKYSVYEVFFMRDGEKRSYLAQNKVEASNRKSEIRRQRRKYLGTRSVELVELA